MSEDRFRSRQRAARLAASAVLVLFVGATASCGSGRAPASTDSPSRVLVSVNVPASFTPSNADPAESNSGASGIAPAASLADATLSSGAPSPETITSGDILPDTSPSRSTIPVVTRAPAIECAGPAKIPADARNLKSIAGNVDGDGADDTISAYTANDGTPHVFMQRGGGNGSDVTLPLGDSDTVAISFEDFDHAAGAAVPPPLVVLALGAAPAGSRVATFLSAAGPDNHCLTRWTSGGQPFTFTIDQRGPFSGLLCDGAAGHVYYVLRTATPDGAGSVATTSREIRHIGAVASFNDLGGQTIPDDPAVQHNYGDIQGCGHPPLFP